MDWNKQIEKLEDELKKLIEKENRLAERKKEVESGNGLVGSLCYASAYGF